MSHVCCHTVTDASALVTVQQENCDISQYTVNNVRIRMSNKGFQTQKLIHDFLLPLYIIMYSVCKPVI